MQDDNQRIRPPPSSSSWHSGCNLGAHGSVLRPSTLPDITVTDGDPAPSPENPGKGAEKQKLRGSDFPLLARILQGPCEQVSKVFLMEKDQVAQYIKFEMPILRSFIQKLEEEEDREVKKLKHKYSILRLMIEQRLEEISEGPTAM
ncbi:hypothetical protein Nmel_018561 [Mimus melanotis]